MARWSHRFQRGARIGTGRRRATKLSPDTPSTRPLLDKLGVKQGSRVAIIGVDEAGFIDLLRERTSDIVKQRPRSPCDIVFLGVDTVADLRRIKEVKSWIEPNGAIWVVRPKGGRSPLRETEVMAAGLATGLVDNKIASFSETRSAMRFVFRLRDRPVTPARRAAKRTR
jgi:hypothetical protein